MLASLLLAGCAGLSGRAPGASVHCRVALPADITAAITAAAVRAALPFSDPMPNERAAPARRLGNRAFDVDYEQDAEQHWLPRADCRLLMRTAEHVTDDCVVVVEPTQLAGLGLHAHGTLHVEVRGDGDGTTVLGNPPPAIANAIQRALAVAIDPAGDAAGAEEANLAAFVGHCLWQRGEAALQHGDAGAGRALLQRAARLPDPPATLLTQLTALTADSGDLEMARDLCLRALAGSHDPMQRSQLAARWSALQPVDEPAAALRVAARERLRQGDLVAAESLLHTARREDPRPAEDYRLLALLHRERHDPTAWACELLAQEHARSATEPSTWQDFVRRVRPMLANALPHLAHTIPAATPGR